MAKNQVPLKKSPPKRSRPLDAELFALAKKVGMVFDHPNAAAARFRLFEAATAYRDRYRPHRPDGLWATKTKWIAFLLRLILTCPRILLRPPDFEWVTEDLEWILARRKFHAVIDRDFWEAVDWIRAPLRTGHPRNKALDYFRFETVKNLMNAPEPLKGLVATCGKEEALRRAADMEEQWSGERPHERVIRRSCDRAEQELNELQALLHGQSSHTPLPTNQLNGKSEKPAKKTPSRRKPSTRPKRARRK